MNQSCALWLLFQTSFERITDASVNEVVFLLRKMSFYVHSPSFQLVIERPCNPSHIRCNNTPISLSKCVNQNQMMLLLTHWYKFLCLSIKCIMSVGCTTTELFHINIRCYLHMFCTWCYYFACEMCGHKDEVSSEQTCCVHKILAYAIKWHLFDIFDYLRLLLRRGHNNIINIYTETY